MSHRIAVIGGDGIGPEVTSEAIKAISATGLDFIGTHYDLGADRYLRDGEVLSDATMKDLSGYDAILLGAIGGRPGDPRIPPGLIERGLLLKLRFAFDHYINLRPFRSASGLKGDPVDLVFVREGTEGSYAGEGGLLRENTPHEVATQGSVNTRMGVERCVRYAFEFARQRPRKRLTLVHKTNVLTFAGGLWRRVFDEISAGYPDIDADYAHVDATCIHLVEDPSRYDVIVTDNLFGDILTDLAGAVSGGIGLAASGNLNPDRVFPSMFEPVHGSAPDIAGQNIANPLAAIRSASMMLSFLGEDEGAERIESAVNAVANEPALVEGSTSELGDAVAGRIE